MTRGWCTALLLALAGCVDGPFARVNPHDRDSDIEIRLVATRDTVTAAETDVAIQVITTPVVRGYSPVWISEDDNLVHLGDGVFRLIIASPTIVPITIRAQYLTREATIVVHRAPAP